MGGWVNRMGGWLNTGPLTFTFQAVCSWGIKVKYNNNKIEKFNIKNKREWKYSLQLNYLIKKPVGWWLRLFPAVYELLILLNLKLEGEKVYA